MDSATYAWCLFGIADLVVAITMGAMTSPGRAHLLALDAPNLLMTAYPLVMVPTFAVPWPWCFMASFCCGYGEALPRAAGWPRPDASRFSNVREGGQVAALPSSARLPQWVIRYRGIQSQRRPMSPMSRHWSVPESL